MFRKVLIGMLAATAAFACWFTETNFNGNYISGVNNYAEHYSGNAATVASATYYNGQSVALPLTVYIKIHAREADQPGETAGVKEITRAVLQYRVRSNGVWTGGWTTVRDYDNPSWDMNTDYPVPLFGSYNIAPKGIHAGDEIYLRLYVTDGVYQSGDLEEAQDSLVVNDTETASSYGDRDGGGFPPPFMFKVVYNGKRRIGF